MTLTMTGGISTVNAKELMAVPFVFVTVTGPVDAPTGTRATRLVPVAERTVAATPLNDT